MAEALRENLQRRKTQERSRKAVTGTDAGDHGDGKAAGSGNDGED